MEGRKASNNNKLNLSIVQELLWDATLLFFNEFCSYGSQFHVTRCGEEEFGQMFRMYRIFFDRIYMKKSNVTLHFTAG